MIISKRFCKKSVKGMVRFEIHFWFVLADLKGIQDVFTVFSILIFFGQTVVVCQLYNAGIGGPPQRTWTEKSNLNMIS